MEKSSGNGIKRKEKFPGKKAKRKEKKTCPKEKIRMVLNRLEGKQRYAKSPAGDIYLDGYPSIGFRKLSCSVFGEDIHEKYMTNVAQSTYTQLVFSSDILEDNHDASMAHFQVMAATDLEPIVVEYPLGTPETLVIYNELPKVLVGSVDFICYDRKNDAIALCELKTISTDQVTDPRVSLLAAYQLFLAEKLLLRAIGKNTSKKDGSQKKKIRFTLYVIVKSLKKLACYRILHVPDRDKLIGCFIE
jgi:hypothetical protein